MEQKRYNLQAEQLGQECRNAPIIFNTYGFSSAKIVTETCVNITPYLNCLSFLYLKWNCDNGEPRLCSWTKITMWVASSYCVFHVASSYCVFLYKVLIIRPNRTYKSISICCAYSHNWHLINIYLINRPGQRHWWKYIHTNISIHLLNVFKMKLYNSELKWKKEDFGHLK
jgi:hypothetical protein